MPNLKPRILFSICVYLCLFFIFYDYTTRRHTETKLWKSCFPWIETVAGKSHRRCSREYGEYWWHTGQARDFCWPGYGKGVCTFNMIPKKNLTEYQNLAKDLSQQKREEVASEQLIDVILRNNLEIIKSILDAMQQSVVIIDFISDNEISALLDKCFHYVGINFYTHQHSAELWIPFQLRNNRFSSSLVRTDNVSNATDLYYYFALYPHMHAICHNGTEGLERFDFAQNHLTSHISKFVESEMWKQQNALNIFIPATHPLVPLTSITSPFLSQLSHPTFFSTDYDGGASYPKDIIVPYRSDVRTYPQVSKRTLLLAFCSEPVQKVRTDILKKYANLGDDIVVRDGHVSSGYYSKLLASSLFCFMIRGDTFSSARLFSLIESGCIPVIVSNWIYLPFQRLIDYSKFCLFVSEGEAMTKPLELIRRLRLIRTEEILLFQKYLFQARFLLLYDSNFFLNPTNLMFIEAHILRRCASFSVRNENFCKPFRT